MTPNHAEHVHAERRRLAALARQHGWTVQLPHSDPGWVWMHAYRQTSGSDAARLGIEWADDIPEGCRLHATSGGRHVTAPVRSVRTLELAIANAAWLVAAVALAADSPVIDLTDGAAA